MEYELKETDWKYRFIDAWPALIDCMFGEEHTPPTINDTCEMWITIVHRCIINYLFLGSLLFMPGMLPEMFQIMVYDFGIKTLWGPVTGQLDTWGFIFFCVTIVPAALSFLVSAMLVAAVFYMIPICVGLYAISWIFNYFGLNRESIQLMVDNTEFSN